MLRESLISATGDRRRWSEWFGPCADHHSHRVPVSAGVRGGFGRVCVAGAQETRHQGHLQPLAAGVLQPPAGAGPCSQTPSRGETYLNN